MNQIGKLLLCPALLGLGLSVQALTPNTRYNTIVEGNVFRLGPRPVVVAQPAPDVALARNIELSGFSTVDGQKKAWFVIKPKPGSKDLPKYVSLAEHEEQEFLNVINISDAEGEVKVKNFGSEMTLSFKNNGTKPVLGVPAVAEGSPPSNVQNMAQPNEGGLRPISRQLRFSPVAGRGPAGTEAPVDPVRQHELMETQKAVYDAVGEPLPPLPPMTTPRSGRTAVAPPSLPQ